MTNQENFEHWSWFKRKKLPLAGSVVNQLTSGPDQVYKSRQLVYCWNEASVWKQDVKEGNKLFFFKFVTMATLSYEKICPVRSDTSPYPITDKQTTDDNFSKLCQRSRDLTSGSASSSSPSWLSSMSARSGLLNLSSSSMARVRLSGCDTNGCWNETGRELVRRHRLNESLQLYFPSPALL